MDSRQSRQQRPPPFTYPQQAHQHSTYASSTPSSSSVASLSSSAGSQSSHMSAPLPSPSANHAPMQYFPSMTGHQQHLPPTSHPLQQAQQQHQQQQQQPAGASTSMAFVGQRGDGGGVPSTAPFLNDFNLLAEAAKRAQMACLSRDLGDIGL